MRTMSIKVACGLITTVIAASAHAGTATTSYSSNQPFQILDGGINMALGSSGLGVLNTTQTDVSVTLPASSSSTQTISSSLVTKLTSLSVALPTVAVNYDNQSGRVLSEDLGGSLTLNVANKNGAATGGSLTLSNLRLDLTRNELTGTVNGANGVGVKDNVVLWSFQGSYNFSIYDAVTVPSVGRPFPCGIDSNGTYSCQDLTGSFLDLNKLPIGPSDMFMTSEANALWSQSLGYNAIGKAALNTVLQPSNMFLTAHPFGTLTSAVPEAGTWSLMSLGLIGLLGVNARRQLAA